MLYLKGVSDYIKLLKIKNDYNSWIEVARFISLVSFKKTEYFTNL